MELNLKKASEEIVEGKRYGFDIPDNYRDVFFLFLLDSLLEIVNTKRDGWFFTFVSRMYGIMLMFPKENFRQQELFSAFAILLVESDMLKDFMEYGLNIEPNLLQEYDEIQFLSTLLSVTGLEKGTPMWDFIKPQIDK